jgi:FKBP-type peptidyl-prolyl cis-trans isomerase FkpA
MLRKFIAFYFLVVLIASCTKTEEVADYSAADKKTIEEYLAANNLTDQAQSTSSGLYYIIEQPGGTYHANINSAVLAYYKGYLTDGTIFDQSTYSANKPASFMLAEVIKGWQEGIPLIGVNGKIKLLVPSELGYGSTAKTGIPANSVLIFDIDLRDIYNK